MENDGYKYDFAISYARENTTVAETLNRLLTDRQAKVFFAPDRAGDMWGRNLPDFLDKTFREKSRYCLLLISEAYIKKQWTLLEWQSLKQRMQIDSETFIFPILIEPVHLVGLSADIHYLELGKFTIEQIVDFAVEKLRNPDATIREPDTQKSPPQEALATKWQRTGALFWISYDLQWTYVELMQGGSAASINRGFRQCNHHANRLNLGEGIAERLNKLREDGSRYDIESDWNPERRGKFGYEIRDIFNIVGRLAGENEDRSTSDGFDAGQG
jgi:hypothetical protein